MSAPPTPQAMADELDAIAAHLEGGGLVDDTDGPKLRDAAKLLRSVPTEAQKIAALDAAGQAALLGAEVAAEAEDYEREPWRKNYTRYEPSGAAAHDAGSLARAAMRLLGIDPEAP